MKKPKVVEVFTDNGEHSHWKLVDTSTGITIWEQPEDDSSIIYKGEKEWNESEIDCCKATNEAHNKSIFHLAQMQCSHENIAGAGLVFSSKKYCLDCGKEIKDQ